MSELDFGEIGKEVKNIDAWTLEVLPDAVIEDLAHSEEVPESMIILGAVALRVRFGMEIDLDA